MIVYNIFTEILQDALSAFDGDVDVDVLDHPVLNLFNYMVQFAYFCHMIRVI